MDVVDDERTKAGENTECRWLINAVRLVWCLVRKEVGQSFVFIMFLHTDSRHKRFFGFTIAIEFKS